MAIIRFYDLLSMRKSYKLPELNADTLKQLNLETLTGKDSRLDFNQEREDSRKRLEARYRGITPSQINSYQNTKADSLRHRSSYP